MVPQVFGFLYYFPVMTPGDPIDKEVVFEHMSEVFDYQRFVGVPFQYLALLVLVLGTLGRRAEKCSSSEKHGKK
jgi:hypothetical protein